MEELFGLPTIRLMWIVLAITGVAAAVIAFIFLRRPILVRMGLRNLPRRRAQTVLVTMGLTLATIIVTIAFSTGDSLAVSIRNLALEDLERIDHFITAQEAADDAEGIPDQVLRDMQTRFADDERVEAIFGARINLVPAEHPAAGQVEPQFYLVGVEQDAVDQLDAVRDTDGGIIALGELGADEIVLSERSARELAAEPGDTVRLYVLGAGREYTVAAIGRDAVLTGNIDFDRAGGLLPLAAYQDLLGPELAPPGEWDLVMFSGAGGVEAPLEFSEALDNDIQEALASLQAASPALYLSNGLPRFESEPAKADALEDAELIASIFTSLFLFMGSFSVAAGILLIFLIFAMLAEERKPEMGIARAIGMQRNDLIQMFISEGMVYNLGAAVIGVVLGLLFAIGMIAALNAGFENFGFHFTWTVTLKSLVISACIGTVITFITVVFSSVRASRLNIVAAIQDIPDSQYEAGNRLSFWVVLRNVLVIAFGALLLLQGLASETLFLYMMGASLAPLGLVMGLNKLRLSGRRINQRLLYTLGAGFVLFLWFIPNDWHERVFDQNLNGGPELFVLAGAMLTASGTLLLVFNLDLIVGAVRSAVGGIGRLAPVIRTAAAYPAAARYRTGMTIAMIGLITFALVNFSTINASFSRAFSGSDTAGGFEVLAFDTEVNEVGDIRSGLAAAGADDVLDGIEYAGRVEAGPQRGTRAVTVLTERWDPVDEQHILDNDDAIQLVETDLSTVRLEDRDAVVVGGVNDDFIDGQEIKLQMISHRYENEDAVWSALRSGAPVAVATWHAVDGAFGFNETELDPWSTPSSVTEESSVLPRIVVEVGLGENARQVEVIAILEQISGAFVDLDGENGSLPTLLLPESVAAQVIGQSETTRHYISTAGGADSLEVAQGIERELRVAAVDIQGELQRQQQTQSSILALFQGFIGIGLVAGLAALGVIALRAVAERRQQIGVLRAIGFQSRLVGFELLIEMGFIALLGLGLGTALALGLAWRLFAEGTFGDVSMYIPLGTVLPMLIGAFAASLVLTYFPARQAARTTIAEALRYE